MNCVIMQMRTHYFRGHTEKKGGREKGEGGRVGEGEERWGEERERGRK